MRRYIERLVAVFSLLVACVTPPGDKERVDAAAPETGVAQPDQAPAADQSPGDHALGELPVSDAPVPDMPPPDTSKPDTGPSAPTWAVAIGGGYEQEGAWDIAMDSTGQLYVIGSYGGTAFSSLAPTAKGKTDIFVAKMDQAGNYIWVNTFGGTEKDAGNSIALDSSGNIYITGLFDGSVSFGSTTLTAKGGGDLFVAKLDSGGKVLWATAAGGAPYRDRGTGIVVDKAGNCYLAGDFHGQVVFGATTITSVGLTDIFVAKVDKSGKFVWATAAGGLMHDMGSGIALDAAGNAFFTGQFNDKATFGSATLAGKGGNEAFVAKVDPLGKIGWTVTVGGTGHDTGSDVALDSAGDIYLTGYFEGNATFGSTGLSASGGTDLYLLKLDKTGKVLWGLSTGDVATDWGAGIALDTGGNAYITGALGDKVTSSLDVLALKVSKSGNIVWSAKTGGLGTKAGAAIVVDSAGHGYIAGSFNNVAIFGSTTLKTTGYSDGFVARLDKTGMF